MKTTDKLQVLVHSLSRNEKRYFRLFSSLTGSGKNYLLLFDVLAAQDAYDEQALRVKFKGKRFMERLSSEKVYLQNLILRSLIQYHSRNNAQWKMLDRIKEIEVLYDKSLFSHASKVASSLKMLAAQHENPIALLNVLRWEDRLLSLEAEYGIRDTEKPERLHREWNDAMRSLERAEQYNYLSRQVILYHKRLGLMRQKTPPAKIRGLIRHPLLRHEPGAAGFGIRMQFYYIKAYYYELINDSHKTLYYHNKRLELMESNGGKRHFDTRIRLSILNNLIVICGKMKRYKLAFRYLEKLQQLPEKLPPKSNEFIRMGILFTRYMLELNHRIYTGRFEEGTHLASRILESMEQYRVHLSEAHRSTFYFNLSRLYMGQQDYASALRWINEILILSSSANYRQDLFCFTRILNLIIHFEMGHHDMLDYLVRAAYRFLYKRESLYKTEASILRFLQKKNLRMSDPSGMTEAFKGLRQEIVAITRDPYEYKVLDEYFDLVSWLEAKISRRPFAEIVREKAGRGS